MDVETTCKLISAAAAVVSILSLITNIIITRHFKNKEERLGLDRDLDSILNISIQYPYLEQSYFTNLWDPKEVSKDEAYARYDLFCNRVFNFLTRVYEHFKKDKKKIEDFVDVKSWVRLHQFNWKNPVDPNENIDGYDQDFRNFINQYLK